MSDLQNRLKAIEDQINGSSNPPSRPYTSSDAESLEHDLKNLKWAVGYLAKLLRKHLETGEV